VRLPTLYKAPASYDEEFVDIMASAYLNQTPWTRLRLAAIGDLVDPQPGQRIVDLGCAAGAITHFLSGYGSHVIGVDSEPLAIERARSLFPNLEFMVADAASLPFETHSLDKAIAADFTEHLDESRFHDVLAEVRRVLRPGGTLSIYTPNSRHLIERLKERNLILAQNPTHIGLRDAEQLKHALEAAGYAVERDDWVISPFPVLRTIERATATKSELFRYRLCIRAGSRPEPQAETSASRMSRSWP
jgi:SAM-dependent methyltransferase